MKLNTGIFSASSTIYERTLDPSSSNGGCETHNKTLARARSGRQPPHTHHLKIPRYASLIIEGPRPTTETMPSSAKQSPPKTCPVCGQSIWKKWDNLPTSPWQRYISHIQSTHPDFAKWSRRSGLTYFLALIPFFAFALAATTATSASEATILAILMFPAGFAVIPIVWMYHHRIKTGFRKSWTQQHGGPLITQRTPNSTS